MFWNKTKRQNDGNELTVAYVQAEKSICECLIAYWQLTQDRDRTRNMLLEMKRNVELMLDNQFMECCGVQPGALSLDEVLQNDVQGWINSMFDSNRDSAVTMSLAGHTLLTHAVSILKTGGWSDEEIHDALQSLTDRWRKKQLDPQAVSEETKNEAKPC